MSSEAGRTDMSQSELKSPDSVAQSRVPHWPSKPAWDEEKEDGRTSKDVAGLVQACPRQATCPGFPSVFEDREKKWIFGEEPLCSLKKQLAQKAVRVDCGDLGQEQTGPPSFLASCPERSSIWGFPSLPEPRRRPPAASVLHLLPLCPAVSALAGFPSAEGCSPAGWVSEAAWLIFSQPKTTECRVSSSASGCKHPGSAWALAPSCPRRTRTPGFPSVPGYSMLALLPLWPKASAVPGCGSEGDQGPSKWLWPCQPHTLMDRPTKAAPFMAHGPGRRGGSVKNMFRLAPSCPEACRTPGFPSHPQRASTVGFTAVSMARCCSGASRTEGLGPAAPGTGWAELAKAVLMPPREKEAEPLAHQQQEHGHSMKVHACPAPPVDRPPDMVSLYAPASCSPCIPGFPSSQTLTVECVPEQPRGKAFLRSPEKDKKTSEMARSCPGLAASPAFPSIPHPSPSTAGETLSCRTCADLRPPA